jgi:hypothetical protein
MKLIPESIRDALVYDPDTGLFCWSESNRKDRAGKPAGCVNKRGYVQISFKKVTYSAHRIAWFLMTGEQPPKVIDHIDTDPANNKWNNLRESNQSLNCLNKGNHTGVTYAPEKHYWKARITQKGKIHYLYYGPDKFEAWCRAKSFYSQVKHTRS